MNPDKQLLVGLVMMGIGGTVALLAFTILREQQKNAKKKAEAEPESTDEGTQATQLKHKETVDMQQMDFKGRIANTFQKIKGFLRRQDQPEESTKTYDSDTDDLAEPTPLVEERLHKRKRIAIFALLRDKEKGNLIVQVGEHEYHSSQDLQDSPDWHRVEYAAADLSIWLKGTQDDADEAKPVKTTDHKPQSMVEQINHFLQRNLTEIEDEKRTIKLYEGPDETVRVLIENNSYAIDEVPDPNVSKLIQAAVAEWEALQ